MARGSNSREGRAARSESEQIGTQSQYRPAPLGFKEDSWENNLLRLEKGGFDLASDFKGALKGSWDYEGDWPQGNTWRNVPKDGTWLIGGFKRESEDSAIISASPVRWNNGKWERPDGSTSGGIPDVWVPLTRKQR